MPRSTKQSAPSKKAPGLKRKKLGQLKPEENFQGYILKVLKAVCPDMGIGKSSMSVMNSIVMECYRQISAEAAGLSRKTGSSLSAQGMQSAVKLRVPGELCKHAISSGTSAYTKYLKSVDADKKHWARSCFTYKMSLLIFSQK